MVNKQKSLIFMHRIASRHLSTMLKHQKTLPKLIVPSLDETCQRYLNSVKPLASLVEYSQTLQNVQTFKATIGPQLQTRLESRAAEKGEGWLLEWWNDYAYMAYRDPLVLNVSYFYAFKDDLFRKDPAARAASTVIGALAFRDLVLFILVTLGCR
jgi:carnitine O-acetyltransferase